MNNRRARDYWLTRASRRQVGSELLHWRRVSRAVNQVALGHLGELSAPLKWKLSIPQPAATNICQ